MQCARNMPIIPRNRSTPPYHGIPRRGAGPHSPAPQLKAPHGGRGEQVQDFENAGATGWNTAVGDAVPLAAANAYGVVLVIHRPGREPTVVLPVAVVLPDPIHLHLQGDHYYYEPLVANEEKVPSSPPSVAGEVGSQAEDDAPRSPPNMEDVPASEPEPETEPASNPMLPDVHIADYDGDDDGASILSLAAMHPDSLRDPVQLSGSEDTDDSHDFEPASEPKPPLKQSRLFPGGKDTAQRRKARTPNTPQVAPLGTTNSAQYLQQQRSQKTNPKFTPAEVILFRRLYEKLNMATRARTGWETFDRRWQQEHKDDETGAIHHRTSKSLVDHASKYRKQAEGGSTRWGRAVCGL